MIASVSHETFPETPEWLIQHAAIASGEKTWDDYTFEERTCHSWLLPYLVEIESQFTGRWPYWLTALETGKLPDGPIPKIHLDTIGNSEAKKMLEKCLYDYKAINTSLYDFLQWILWGFGEVDQKPRLDEKVNEFWYRTFNLGLLLQHPYDYFAYILAEKKTSSKWNNPNAFFPTPHSVCECMAQMNFAHAGEEDTRLLSVADPCVGTGSMLMSASNYSVNLYGIDIDHTCIMACKINGYLYMPWLVKPGEIEGLDHVQWPHLICGNALTMGMPDKPDKPVEKKREKVVQLTLF